jgi:CMP-N-acetylneuraminic acid synthetase
MPKVTVYIPAHNYGRYLDKAIKSVLYQSMSDWELIIIDDGSTDNTGEVLEQYRGDHRIHIVEQENKGLNVTNNIALRLATGKYVMRLDADDFLDENILLVLSHILDSKPEIGLVYPDYYLVDDEGSILEMVRRKKIGEEVTLLDLPPQGACTMIRKEVLTNLGGYYEEFTRQDTYGMWLKFIEQYHPYNVNVPLFYYRQHPASLTNDKRRLLETRRQIQRRFLRDKGEVLQPRVLVIVPVLARNTCQLANPFTNLAGKPLIDYTIEEVTRSTCVDRVVLSCEDTEVLHYAEKFSRITPLPRPKELTKSTARIERTALFVLESLENQDGYRPDAICVCYINTPFRRAEHIEKAIDTMSIFKTDSVISIQEELAFCYHHRRHGLASINGSRQRNLRLERHAIFKENGAIYLTRSEVIRSGRLLGDTIGHITMLPEESIRINSAFDFWLAEKIATEWRNQATGQ